MASACHRSLRLAIVAVLLFLASPRSGQAEEGFYRFPTLHGDTVVFTAEGDLWTVSTAGGAARRLTTHAAEERQAAISPDGEWLAFAASYDSGREAYVMPLAGGAPRRLTWDGQGVSVQGWTPKGEVLYATQAVVGPLGRRVLRAVDPETLAVRTLPLHDAHEAAFDPVQGTVFFTRLGLQLTGDNARAYRGGALAQLWRFEPGSGAEAVRLASADPADDHRPMWWQGRLVFVSDASGAHNVWSMASDGSDRRQHTFHRDWDVRGANLDAGRVVYQLGADLRLLDLASGDDRRLAIELVSDFDQRRVRRHDEPLSYLSTASLAPAGDALLLTARGRLAKVAPGPQRRVEIAVPAVHRARAGVLSVDGRHVFAITDATGEQEIWRFAADGSAAAEPLTSDGRIHRWSLHPSPDGRWLAHDDKSGRLFLLDLETRANRQIDQGPGVGDDPYAQVVWSPDSKTLALVRADSASQRNQILLYDLATGRLERLTSDRYPSFAPAFSPDGKWLYFLSDRHYVATPGAPWGDRNLGPQFDRRTKVYAYALQPALRFPFQAADELAAGERATASPAQAASDGATPAAAKGGRGKGASAEPAAPTPADELPAIVWSGLADRLYEVPIAPANYRGLLVDQARLYLLDAGSGADAKPSLLTLAIASDGPSPEVFASEVAEVALSKDRKKLYFQKWKSGGAGAMYLVDAGAKAPADLTKAEVRVGDWRLALSPHEEWRQMFVDAWRMHRDFSFDPQHRGVDWAAVRAKYEPLVARLTARGELDDLLAQMASELGILHSQIRPGELPGDEENTELAGLGAELVREEGGARVRHVYRTEAELPSERGPLARAGVDVRVGDLITAVNGRAVTTVPDLAELLADQAGQQVLLEVERGGSTHRVVVLPVSADREANLRYQDWVQATRERVEVAGAGRIGYLHLRAMGAADLATFARELYANLEREGLIIDVRRNRGGNIDSFLIEKLLRRVWGYWAAAGQLPSTNMQQTFRGHVVVLIDQLTYSDGETFAAAVKALGIAPLVGMRTAGAGIWLSDRNALADAGMARVAEFAQFRASDGSWLIEGSGVSPDVEVDNPPHASFRGEDAQLARALAILAERMEAAPRPPLVPGPIGKLGTPGADVERPPGPR
jgi:tricorn protease